MKPDASPVLALILACALALGSAAHAQTTSTGSGQAWPVKPVRVIVPFTAGGSADTLGRIAAGKLSETLGQTFVVENRGGAGGLLGADLVVQSRPDGYTLVVSGIASHVLAPALAAKLPFDPMKDATHIALLGGPPAVLAVHPSLPARNVKEFVTLAKARPKDLSYGSPGNGTLGHLVAELFKQVAGISVTHVPYKGASGALVDLVAGHIQAVSTTLTTASGPIRSGRARALAISSVARLPDYPGVPTFREAGYPALTSTVWFGISGPAGMPPEIVGRLNTELRRIMNLPEVRERLRPDGIEANTLDAKAFTEFMAAEVKRWWPIVRASGAREE